MININNRSGIFQPIRKLWLYFCEDSLFRNSVYLMLATAVMAIFGFGFWLINTRIFSTTDIGIATTLISVMSMISVFSLIGFDSAFIRFLPNSDKKNDQLNTGFILVGIAGFAIAILFIILAPHISPQISFVRDNFLSSFIFIAFCMMSALNILAESVFIAYRRTKFVFIIDSIFSIIKMVLPLAFIGWGAFGVFTAAAVSQAIGFILSLSLMIIKFDYHPKFTVSKDVLNIIKKYCFVNYIAGVLNLLPITLLPIIIINQIGTEQAAYYYIIMMIANLLYVIPQATTKSLFAESSHNEEIIFDSIKKSIKIIGLLLIPGIVTLMLWGGEILHFFGKNFAGSDGINFMRFAAIAAIPLAVYYIFTSLFRINKDLSAIIAMDIVYAVSILGLAYLLTPFGLNGIGLAWVAGNTIAGVAGYILYYRSNLKKI